MANPFDEVLGLGFAGCGFIDDQPVLLLPSGPDFQENLLKSQGSMSTNIALATGEVFALDARSVTKSFTCYLTNSSINAIANAINWRAAGSLGQTHKVDLKYANGDGVFTEEAFLQSLTITAGEGALAQVTFNMISWTWTEVFGTNTPRFQEFIAPWQDQLQPIPYWLTTVNHTAQNGPALAWSITANHNWQFKQLTLNQGAPTPPQLAACGPLYFDLSMTSIAQPALRPGTQGGYEINIGGANPSMFFVPLRKITAPFVVRDPGYQVQSVGEQDSLIRFTVTWRAVSPAPTVT